MTAEIDETLSTSTYSLVCNDCQFETTTDGSFLDALDVADAHQAEYGKTATEHFVNIELDRQQ